MLPTPIEKVQSKVIASLVSALGEMFDKADDTLFQMADRAETNTEQNTYFESMREIRVKRRGMESAFRQELTNYFSVLPKQSHREEVEGGLDHISVDSLSIVQNDELEENVALDGMVNKTRSRLQSGLSGLHIRFDTLMPTVRVDEKNNPLDPKQICTAFSSASAQVDLEIKAKLILFKLFEKSVLLTLEKVIEGANAELISQGILPDLKVSNSYQYRRPRQVAARSRAPRSPYQEGMNDQHFGDAGFSDQLVGDAMHDPYAHMPARQDGSGGAAAGYGNGEPADGRTGVFNMLQGLLHTENSPNHSGNSGGAISAGAMLQRTELMSVLSELQHLPQFQPAAAGVPIMGDDLAAFNVRQAINSVLSDAASNHSGKSLEKNDDDVINLVAMLFEFILGDPNLPEAIKVLLGRLQIPILKVAIADKSFFSKAGHSARKLINELAKAGIGISDQAQHAQDKLQSKITTIVDRVCEEFDTDMSLFDELLADFIGFVQKEAKRAELIEKRTKDAEEGRAKTENARQSVEGALAEKLEGKVLPQVVSILLHEAWANVLFLINLKEGVESEAWRNGLATVDDLLWSIDHRADAQDRQKLMRLVPELLNRLKQGLATISYNHFEMSKLFDELEKVHMQCLRGQKPQYLVEYEQNQQHNSFADIPVLEPDPEINQPSNLRGKVKEEVASNKRREILPLEEELAADENAESELAPVSKASNTDLKQPAAQPVKESEPSIKENEPPADLDRTISADEAQSIAAEFDLSDDDFFAANSTRSDQEDPADALIKAVAKDIGPESTESVLGDTGILFDSVTEEATPSTQQDLVKRGEAAAAALNAQQGIQNTVTEEPEESVELDPNDEHMVMVSGITVGHWVEFKSDGEEASFRCKLAARLQSADKLIFVNRLGIKVAEKSTPQLALELKRGEAKILSDRLLFDRALEALIGDLRDKQSH